ncbi:hypothetical protein KCU78_g10638, partial [Aureobasidium melanogenum]
MVLVNTHSTTFTDVVVEFFSGRRSNLTVLHSIEAVLKSLRQPPSFRNTIRLGIIERATCKMSSPTDLIKRISVINPFLNFHIADRHIDTPVRLHSWYFPDESLQSCTESGDGCFTPDSETSSPVEEHNSSDKQSLAEGAPSHRGASVDTAQNTIEGRLICLASMIGIVKALFDIALYLRANPDFLEFESWIEVGNACVEHIWIQTCIFGFPIYMFFRIMQNLRGGTG